MKIEDILGHTAQELIDMTDAQLESYLEPYYKYTRPESCAEIPSEKVKPVKIKKKSLRDELLEMVIDK